MGGDAPTAHPGGPVLLEETPGDGRVQCEVVIIVQDSPSHPELWDNAEVVTEEASLLTAPNTAGVGATEGSVAAAPDGGVLLPERNPDTQRAPMEEAPPTNGSGAAETDRATSPLAGNMMLDGQSAPVPIPAASAAGRIVPSGPRALTNLSGQWVLGSSQRGVGPSPGQAVAAAVTP